MANRFWGSNVCCQCQSNSKPIDKNISDHIKQLTLYLIRQLNIQFLKKAVLLQHVKDDILLLFERKVQSF
jgi:hypothetical protein